MTGKILAVLVSIATLFAFAFAGFSYFQPRAVAQVEHLQLSEYTERARLDNELKLTVMEVAYLLNMGVRTPEEENRLQYLNSRRLTIEARLLELTGA